MCIRTQTVDPTSPLWRHRCCRSHCIFLFQDMGNPILKRNTLEGDRNMKFGKMKLGEPTLHKSGQASRIPKMPQSGFRHIRRCLFCIGLSRTATHLGTPVASALILGVPRFVLSLNGQPTTRYFPIGGNMVRRRSCGARAGSTTAPPRRQRRRKEGFQKFENSSPHHQQIPILFANGCFQESFPPSFGPQPPCQLLLKSWVAFQFPVVILFSWP
jgi:hypothetical protein